MCNEENNNTNTNNCGCLHDILKRIVLLQKQDYDNECFVGCDKPYLGPACSTICYNTRPIMLYNCCTGNAWSFPYTIGDTSATSTIFRAENIDECCCTCRVLAPGTTAGTYQATNDFFTIDLKCVGAIKCLTDVFVDLC